MESRNSRRIVTALRISFGFILLAALFFYVDPVSILPLLAQVELRWVLTASGYIALATLLGAVNVYMLIGPELKLPFHSFLPLYWMSWAVGLVAPGQVGDIASITALLHRRGYAWRLVLSRSLLDKLVSFLVLLGFAFVALDDWLRVDLKIWFIVGVVVVTASVAYLIVRGGLWIKRRGGVFAKAHKFFQELGSEVWRCCLNYPQRLAMNLCLTLVKMILTGASYWCVFRAFGFAHVLLADVVPLVAASSLVAYLPVSFNGIGTVEAAGLALFGSLMIPKPIILTAYLLLRVVVMIVAWVPSGMWLLLPAKKSANDALSKS